MVRYDAEYNSKIARTVANFNKKVARLNKAGVPNIPAKVSVRDIKSRFDNRSDLNYYLRDLQRFSKRGAEKTVTIKGKEFTRYDVDIFRRRLKNERARVRRELKQTSTSPFPVRHDLYAATLRAREERLGQNWESLLTSRLGQKLINEPIRRSETYDNYLEILFQDAYVIDFDEDKINYIKNRLLKLKPRQFVKALENDPNIQFIFDYYHALTRSGAEIEATDAFEQLYNNIDAIVEQYM